MVLSRQVCLAVVHTVSAYELGALSITFHEGTLMLFMYLYTDEPKDVFAAQNTLLNAKTQRIPNEFMQPIISRLDAWAEDLGKMCFKLDSVEYVTRRKRKKKKWRKH